MAAFSFFARSAQLSGTKDSPLMPTPAGYQAMDMLLDIAKNTFENDPDLRVSMQCYASKDGGANWYLDHGVTISGGVRIVDEDGNPIQFPGMVNTAMPPGITHTMVRFAVNKPITAGVQGTWK